jgi:hypothetical protein
MAQIILLSDDLNLFLHDTLPPLDLEDDYLKSLDVPIIQQTLKTELGMSISGNKDSFPADKVMDVYNAINKKHFYIEYEDGRTTDFHQVPIDWTVSSSEETSFKSTSFNSLTEKVKKARNVFNELITEITEDTNDMVKNLRVIAQDIDNITINWEEKRNDLKASLFSSEEPVSVLSDLEKTSLLVDKIKALFTVYNSD